MMDDTANCVILSKNEATDEGSKQRSFKVDKEVITDDREEEDSEEATRPVSNRDISGRIEEHTRRTSHQVELQTPSGQLSEKVEKVRRN